MDALDIADRLGDVIRDQMPAPDSDSPAINWAMVESARVIRERLQVVEDFITGKGA